MAMRRQFLKATGLMAVSGVLAARAGGADRPNILWITSEDNSANWLGCYGNKYAQTPNIDRLAREGFRYLHCYSNGAVCSATRGSWITGMYSPSVGNHHHRSRVAIPPGIPLYPEALKAAGYHVANHTKTDYNLLKSPRIGKLWNSASNDWNEAGGKPFFQVINLVESHESRLFDAKLKPGRQPLGGIENYEGFAHDPQKLEVFPYHPDIPGVRATYARYYDAITTMDGRVGEILQKLEADGLAGNTIVIHNSDHGGALPAGKRYMENSGTHCPLIVRIPEKFRHLWPAERPGSTVDRLVSFVDMPKTWISLAGGTPPAAMQGRIFLGPNQEPEARWHFSYRGRNDVREEFSRAVRDKKYLYIRNYYPFVPKGQYVDYQWKILAQREWEAAYKAGLCNEVSGRYFLPRGMDELYDTEKDPHCVANLVGHPEQRERVETMRKELNAHARRIVDTGFVPEADMLKRAADRGCTVYEVANNPALYRLDAYIEMADLAIAADPANLAALAAGLEHADAGVRYWAALGCMMLGDGARPAQDALLRRLEDDSHEVRTMAAWALIKLGEKKPGYACIEAMLAEDSYATLKIHNVIDWMEADGKPLIAFMQTLPSAKGEREDGSSQLMDYLFGKQ